MRPALTQQFRTVLNRLARWPRPLVAMSVVLALFLSLGPSAVQASECQQLCFAYFWESATLEDVRAELAGGANIRARAKDGETPLHFAARYASTPAIITTLVEAGADVNARDKDGWTPLLYAARYDPAPAVITTLLEGGADPAAQTRDGQTPFDLIQENDKLKGTEVYWRLNDVRYNK